MIHQILSAANRIYRMRKELEIGFYTAESADRAIISELKGCDALLLSIKDTSFVGIRSELDGKSEVVYKMSGISAACAGVCFFSATTESYGLLRRSVLAFYGGKLRFIADANGVYDKGFSPTYGVKSITARDVSFGVAVGSDILDQELLRSLALTGNDLIINLSPDIYDFDTEKLVSSLVFLNGVAIASAGFMKKVVCSGSGEVVYSGKDSYGRVLLPLKIRYREKITKVRF